MWLWFLGSKMFFAFTKKKCFQVFCYFVFFLSVSTQCFAVEKTLRIGHYPGFNIFGESKEKNSKALGHDSLMELAQQAQVKVELVELGSSSYVEFLYGGRIDIAGLMVPVPQLTHLVSYSKNSFGYAQFGLASKSKTNLFYDDPQSIHGKKVATFHGNSANPLFRAYTEKNNITVEYIHGSLDNYTELDADYYLIFSSIKNIHDFEIVLRLGKLPLHFAVKKGNEALLLPLEEAFTVLTNRKTSVVRRILDKFEKIDEKFDNRTLTRAEAELVRGRTFTVGFIENNPPFQYLDDQGQPQGMSIDILNILAERYDFQVVFKPYEIIDGASSANIEEFDLMLSLKGDKKHVDTFFRATDPYYLVQMIMLIKNSGNSSIENILKNETKIGMLQNIAFDYSELNRLVPKASIQHYNSFSDLVQSFERKQIDAAVFTSSDAQYASALIDGEKHLYPLGIELPISVYISNKWVYPYLDIFNTMLSDISYQSLYEINFKHTVNYSPIYSLEDFLLEYWPYLLGMFFTVAFFFAMYLMKVQMNKKNEILRMLNTDDITSLSSSRYFSVQVKEKLKAANPSEYELITLDIDYFRMINKHYGMEKGTQVICYMADALQKAYANSDVLMSRNHSEQFAIFKRIDVGFSIEHVVEEFIVRAIKDVVGKNYSLTLSAGIYPIVDPQEEISDMIDFADIARRRGKALHKMTYVTFNEKMRKDFLDTIHIVHRMEGALKDGEFIIVLQPKVCFETLKIIGAEALVRWIPAEGGPIYPDKFISTMETDGFISELDLYVFEKVCAFVQENSMYYRVPKIAVNLSAVTMCEPNIVEKLIAIAKRYNVSPSNLELELTESALNAFEDAIIKALSRLKSLGFSIAMDDFGTGESSLNRLGVIKVDVLKLDKSFLNFNQNADQGHIVVEKIIELAKELNMKIVSEGVETLEQVLWLRGLQCHIAQGYYFSRPVDLDTFKQLLKDDITFSLEEK